MITKESVLKRTAPTTNEEAFSHLYDILKILRSPEGCPWDRKQTPEIFSKNIIEEAYEYIDALENDDTIGCQEELGDIYLVITMLSIMHEENESFSLVEILNTVSDKLIRRHPHVFTHEVTADDADAVITIWDSIKENVEGKKTTYENPYQHIPKALPPLEYAEEIQKIARKKGFDWPTAEGAIHKIEEELQELKIAITQENAHDIEEELGDLMFSVVNVGRLCEVTTHIALHKTNNKFIKRYNDMVTLFDQDHDTLFEDATFEDMDLYWEKAKKLTAVN